MTKLVPKVKVNAKEQSKITLFNSKNKEAEARFTDLRQVMDYTKAFSIFYSGVEAESYFNCVYDMGVRDFLVSYEYMKGKGSRLIKRFKNLHDVRLFVDSGAFTIFNNPDEYKNYTNEMWETRIQEYLKWAERHKSIIFAIADLDLQDELGTDLVNSWRKKYFEPFMLRTGIPVCFVWHESDGDIGWERMCQRYPYVATSLISDDLGVAEIKTKFKIAEKYNTLIQGMGSTRTSILPEFPFYTVDSTTWLIGLQYGEVNYWNSNQNKLIRLKKEKWKKEYIDRIVQETGVDRDNLLKENKEEMIKVNVYAFICAEQFIRGRHKKLIYWQKPKTVKVDINSLPPDFFPPLEWLETPEVQDNYKDYAKNMNINPDIEKQAAINLITDMTVFLNWSNPDYRDFIQDAYVNKETLIQELHDIYVNKIVESNDDRIDDLIEFFKSCLRGENDRLLLTGTNFDRVAKERDVYLEEEQYSYEDITQTEVTNIISSLNLLPDKESAAPEIDILDEEIFKQTSITPYRNERGVIIGGKRQVGRPKKIYSDKYPKFNCDNCFQAAKCEHYKAGHICIFNKLFKRFDTRNTTDIIQAMQSLVDFNLERTQRAMIMEMMSGIVDPTVTGLVNQNMQLLNNLRSLYETSNAEILKQTRVIKSDGTQEDTLEVMNPSKGSILERMFSNIKNKDEVIVDADIDIIQKTTAGEVIME